MYIIFYILFGIIVSTRAIFVEIHSLDYYQITKWDKFILTLLFNFLFWPLTIIVSILTKRYTIELDKKWLKKNYPNLSNEINKSDKIW